MNKNKARRAELQRAYYYRNKEACIASARRWRRANKEWARAYTLKRALRWLGLTVEWYEEKLRLQGGLCGICGLPPSPGTRLIPDHRHDTNTPRELLCHHCNIALGHFKDNPELCRKAAGYLEKYK